MLSRKGLEIEERSLIYSELVANLSEKSSLTAEEADELLCGLAYIQKYPLHHSLRDPPWDLAARKASHLHAKILKSRLHLNGVPNEALLNKILKTLDPTSAEQTWILVSQANESLAYSTSDGVLTVYPLQGILFSSEDQYTDRPLPKMLLENATFRTLFPTIKKGKQIGPQMFSFLNENKRKIYVKLTPKGVVIERKIGEEFYRYTSLPKLSSEHLSKQFTPWVNKKKKVLFYDLKTDEKKYEGYVGDENKIRSIKRRSDNCLLSKPSSLMRAFEFPEYIHEWYSGDALKQIELPRYGLTFSVDPKDPARFKADQHKGFYLKPKEVLPKLGSYPHYLVLENKMGQKKIIFPYQHFKSPENKNSLLPGFAIDPSSMSSNYFIYDLTKDGLHRLSI